MLEVLDLNGGYGAVQVLWNVSLCVAGGQIVALIGGNGAGKTTLLKTISGILRPTSGRVSWSGREIAGLLPERVLRTGIAHVPEGRRLFAGLTVRENLLVGAYHRRDREIQADLGRVLDLFPRLGQRLNEIGGRLSGGEQQMCALARGLMSRPRLIMIDELSLGLAPNLAEHLLASLQDIARSGTAVLLVEQDVAIALEAATRAYVLETGRIVLEGSGEELLADPRVRDAYLGGGAPSR
jgi:branched-chain amino acid transport system ATP-binding protein